MLESFTWEKSIVTKNYIKNPAHAPYGSVSDELC